jgi:RluA family pseudouridine synthase
VAKLPYIEFANGMRIPILHEDRNVIAIDKPQGWMLAPVSWQNTGRNLFAALTSSVNAGDFWARSRNLKFIRFCHRLDADTSGVLLLVKAPGAMPAFTELFEDRHVEKVYLAVVKGVPEVIEWKCRLRLAPMAERPGRMEINNAIGKDSETLFRVIDKKADRALVMCWPLTGRTHQIRLHLAAVGHPVWGDEIYGAVPTTDAEKTDLKLALRSIRLSYKDPFLAEPVSIEADAQEFVKLHGFDPSNAALKNFTAPEKALEHPKARLEDKRRAEKEARQQERSLRREERSFDDDRESSRDDWQQDEDSAGFASEQNNPGGEAPFRERPPRQFGRGPRSDARPGSGRSFDGPRQFERREGGFGRKPAGGGGRNFEDRPPRRPAYGKPAGGPREFSAGAGGSGGDRPRSFGNREERGAGGARGGGFRGPPRESSGYGRPYSDRGPRDDRGGGFRRPSGSKPGYGRPYEDRGPRRPYGGGEDFTRGGDDRGNREGANERRPGVFPSSAKYGLKAGFQKSGGFGASTGRRPFRSTAGERPFRAGGEGRPFRPRRDDGPSEGGRPPGKFSGGGGGGFGKKPFRKFGGGKPAWGKKPTGRPFKKFQ